MAQAGLSGILARLRSRRLAVGLILAFAAYSLVGSTVPQGPPIDPRVAAWARANPGLAPIAKALGLHHAYTTPLFLALSALLTAATVACALERTRVAFRERLAAAPLAEDVLERLRTRPAVIVPIGEGVDDALGAVERRLATRRFKVRRAEDLLEARSGAASPLGSAIYHWALAGLFIVVALGQATRAEGLIGIPVGSSRVDEASNYGRLDRGPFYPGLSGWRIAVSDFVLEYREPSGVLRGASPVVTLLAGEIPLTSGRVYPNRPLAYGTRLVHMSGHGISPTVVLEDASGREVGRQELLIDFAPATPLGSTPAEVAFTAPDGRDVRVTVEVPPARQEGVGYLRRLPKKPVARFVPSGSSPTTVAPGEAISFPGGSRLRLVSLGYYARLSVADDWSVYPIYLLFVIAGAGMSIALLARPRAAWVTVAEDGRALHALVRRRRADRTFPSELERLLIDAIRSADKDGA